VLEACSGCHLQRKYRAQLRKQQLPLETQGAAVRECAESHEGQHRPLPVLQTQQEQWALAGVAWAALLQARYQSALQVARHALLVQQRGAHFQRETAEAWALAYQAEALERKRLPNSGLGLQTPPQMTAVEGEAVVVAAPDARAGMEWTARSVLARRNVRAGGAGTA
jgi:hypothetical protein